MLILGCLMVIFGAWCAFHCGVDLLLARFTEVRRTAAIGFVSFVGLAIVGYFIASANWPPPAPPELLRREEPEP